VQEKIGFTAYYFDLRAQQERLPERGGALFFQNRKLILTGMGKNVTPKE
jgi:hypothetical protein